MKRMGQIGGVHRHRQPGVFCPAGQLGLGADLCGDLRVGGDRNCQGNPCNSNLALHQACRLGERGNENEMRPCFQSLIFDLLFSCWVSTR